MKTEHPWKITIGSQEELVIPQPLAALAQFTNGKSFDVAVNVDQIVITEKQSLRGLVDQFIMETQKEMGHLKPTDTWNDEMTVGQYLALSEEQRDRLWEDAFAQAHSEMENEKEIDADADYVPLGQRDCQAAFTSKSSRS